MAEPRIRDHTSGHDADEAGLLWGTLRIVASQLERIVALNLCWAAQVLPGLAGLIFDGWWLPVRAAAILYTVIAWPIGTVVLFRLCTEAVAGELIDLPGAREAIADCWRSGLRTLLPLLAVSGIGAAAVIATFGSPGNVSSVAVLPAAIAQLVVLLLLTCSVWWGPLSVDPAAGVASVLPASIQLVRRFPGRSLLLTGLTVLVGLVAVVTGLWLLVAGCALAILQIRSVPGRLADSFERRDSSVGRESV